MSNQLFENITFHFLFILPVSFLAFTALINFSTSSLLIFLLQKRLFFTPWLKSFLTSRLLFSFVLVSNSSGFSLSSPLFNETVFSYVVLPWPQSSQSYLSFTEFEITFRPSMPDGMLLYSEDAGSGDFLAINMVDRYVEFRFDCGSGGAVIRCWTDLLLFCCAFYVLIP